MNVKDHILFIQNFTNTYKGYRENDKYNRELACLRQQFPTMMLDPEVGDLFVGRYKLPAIGFTPQEYGSMGGIGYYINDDKIDELKSDNSIERDDVKKIDELVDFWKIENTTFKIRSAYPDSLNEAFPSDHWTEDSEIAFPLYRLAGSMLDYQSLVTLGVEGIRERIERLHERGTSNDYYIASLGVLGLFRDVCLDYIERIEQKIATGMSFWLENGSDMITVLSHISEKPPATLREAIQLMFLYNSLSGSLNYGRIDNYLGSFLKNDMERGRITEAEADSYFESLWRLMISRNTPTDGRVIVGGKGRDDESAADMVALLAIRTTMRVKNVLPQLTLRFYDGQNPDLIDTAMESIAQGNTFPMLYNDDVNITAVEKAFSIPREEAEQYVPYGCGEYVIEKKSIGTPSGVINLLKALEITLFNGYDVIAEKKGGLETGRFEDFDTFEDFFRAYETQVDYFIEQLARQEALEYKVAGECAPFLFMSLLYDQCLERGKPLLEGGLQYLGGTVETYGNANTSDSLLAIKKLVFDGNRISPEKLKKMIIANFKGYEEERQLMLNTPKYGNDDSEADDMYLRVNRHVCHKTKSMAARVGLNSYLVVNINNSANTILGRKTAASPDGRLAYTSMANGNSASPGMDKNGITSYLNSIAKPDSHIHAGYVQNIKLTPDLFMNNMDKVKALMRTYFRMGGTQLMVNVVNNADLVRAMKHPEEYPTLIVRVGGFSARFIDLDPDVQLEIINRTTY